MIYDPNMARVAHIRKVSAMDEHTLMWAEEIVAKSAPQVEL